MRTLIVAVNAKYEHENPAPWYLKAACDARNGTCGDVDVLVGTINDPPGSLFGRVVGVAPDVVALSCYIWNRDSLLRLCADLRAACPEVYLVVGGPEVSYTDGGDAFLVAGVDAVLAGEGEERFPDLLERLARGERPDAATRGGWRQIAPPLPAGKLFSPCLPPYLKSLSGRIAYVEASRGCPYRCSYCLSSESTGLTLLPLVQVFADVAALLAAGAKVIKFVDRTFNLSDERTLAIWHHLRQYGGKPVTFHFEIAPDRLTEAQLQFLSQAPVGLFQVEAGIQSVHAQTLRHIGRVMDVDKALAALARLRAAGTVHVHADLIAGLPGEDADAFAVSFDRLSAANPHQLQLGFLKLLRGTRIRREAEQWGYVARTYAPYEILSSSTMSVADLLRLKEIEETVERYRNSGKFLLLLQWLGGRFASPFALFEALVQTQRKQGILGRAVSSEVLFQTMHRFLTTAVPNEEELMIACDLLRLDWICAHRNPFLPKWLSDGESSTIPETNDLLLAYGEQDVVQGQPERVHKNLRNRYHVRELLLPDIIRDGVHAVASNGEGTQAGRARVIVDTREVHPVLGRPEVIRLDRCIR